MFEKKPVAKFRSKNIDVLTAAAQQMKEEIGDQILTETQLTMLKQKYGIVDPRFTGWELNTVLHGVRKAA